MVDLCEPFLAEDWYGLLQAMMLFQSYGTTSRSCPEDTILQESSQSSVSYNLCASSSVTFPLGVSGVTDAPLRDEHTIVTYSWHFDQLSVIVSVCWKNKLLWWGVRAALTYGCTDNYLLNHFRMAVVSSPPRSMTSPATRSWLVLQHRQGFPYLLPFLPPRYYCW